MGCSDKKVITEERLVRRNTKKAPYTAPTEPPVEEPSPVPLVCWWCVHTLPQHPCIHLPIRYDDRLKSFTVIGNFCSWQCSKAYAIDMATCRSGEIQTYIALMRKQTFGHYVPLWPAPKRQALACFGGTMSIEEFRSYGGSVEPPVVHYPFEKRIVATIGGTVTEDARINAPSKPTGTGGRLAAIENSTTSGDTLKLKRNKPLARSESKLENVLGIRRKGAAPTPVP